MMTVDAATQSGPVVRRCLAHVDEEIVAKPSEETIEASAADESIIVVSAGHGVVSWSADDDVVAVLRGDKHVETDNLA